MAVPFNNGMRNMGPPQFGQSPHDHADQAALHAAILHLHRQTLDAIVKHHKQKKTQQGTQAPRY